MNERKKTNKAQRGSTKGKINYKVGYLAYVAYNKEGLRLRLNRLQSDSGNDFPENRCVWLVRKILFSGN